MHVLEPCFRMDLVTSITMAGFRGLTCTVPFLLERDPLHTVDPRGTTLNLHVHCTVLSSAG
jgi:hypothetical protein